MAATGAAVIVPRAAGAAFIPGLGVILGGAIAGISIGIMAIWSRDEVIQELSV